jgi:hypothetical protein
VLTVLLAWVTYPTWSDLLVTPPLPFRRADNKSIIVIFPSDTQSNKIMLLRAIIFSEDDPTAGPPSATLIIGDAAANPSNEQTLGYILGFGKDAAAVIRYCASNTTDYSGSVTPNVGLDEVPLLADGPPPNSETYITSFKALRCNLPSDTLWVKHTRSQIDLRNCAVCSRISDSALSADCSTAGAASAVSRSEDFNISRVSSTRPAYEDKS